MLNRLIRDEMEHDYKEQLINSKIKLNFSSYKYCVYVWGVDRRFIGLEGY